MIHRRTIRTQWKIVRDQAVHYVCCELAACYLSH